MIAYDRRQNRGKSNKGKQSGGKNGAQNKSRGQSTSFSSQPSRKPPGMEGKCMRCGKPEHTQGQKCAAKKCQMQRLPQDWAFLQSMSVQEDDQESQLSPSNTTG